MWPFADPYPSLKPADVGVRVPSDSFDIPAPDSEAVYDYIIVGGKPSGTAGCVVASRLSEDEGATVLLLERGPVVNTWASRVPLISSNFQRDGAPVYAWDPLPLPNLPKEQWADYRMISGKALGGTSMVNSMLYTRGAPAEYNLWAEKGCKGWSYEDVEPYFMKSEKALGSLGKSAVHGVDGVWQTRSFNHLHFSHYAETTKAAASLGLPFIPDPNSRDHPAYGCASLDVTMDGDGRRNSAYHAFLPLALVQARRARLKIAAQTVVSRIAFERSPTGRPRAVGVFFESEESSGPSFSFFARARKEVILSAGAIGSPQLLLLSGVGPADHLKEQGIPIIKPLKGVGSNLQDHVGVSVQFQLPLYDSIYAMVVSRTYALQELAKYLIFGTGMFLAPITQLSIFARSDLLDEASHSSSDDPKLLNAHDSRNIPDIEIMPIPSTCTREPPDAGRGALTFLTCLTQPVSRGSVRLQSKDPRVRPACDLGYFTADEDWRVIRKGIDLATKMGELMQEAGYPLEPWRVLRRGASEEELKLFVGKQIRTCYHYSSTCRMAPEDSPDGAGVVDDELRVHGIDGLRIADASIFPNILGTHLQAPTVMVGEKCAAMIKAEHA